MFYLKPLATRRSLTALKRRNRSKQFSACSLLKVHRCPLILLKELVITELWQHHWPSTC